MADTGADAAVDASPAVGETQPEEVAAPAVEAPEASSAGGDEAVSDDKPTEGDVYGEEPSHVPGEVNDVATLTNLNEDTLLEEIKIRYSKDNIYTFVSDILIAVNPFKQLGIYTDDVANQYRNVVPSFVPPHVWVIADQCFHNLFKTQQDQCCVISGESGAGKTESAKLIIKHIIRLCEEKGGQSGLEQGILDVSPILEAFGNAQTVMNDNSSRFGKYTRLLFSEEGQVMGAQLSEYLLEKSRVMEQDPGERNFHVLYYLFADDAIKEKYGLGGVADFNALSGEVWDDNAAMLAELVAALGVVGFTKEEDEMVYSVLATILHLSNVEFEGEEKAAVKQGPKGMDALDQAGKMLGLSGDSLEKVLTTNVNITRGETIVRHYKLHQAYDCRDALAKCLYGNLFGWLVGRINEMLAPELHQKKVAGGRPGAAQRNKPAHEIGVLDIFGFEIFEQNSFEQVCINLAHEQLQFFFNRHTFKLELEAYKEEGIDVQAITFKDNSALINMFLEKPIGILTLLDEESNFPKATDETLVTKLEQHFKDHESYVVPEKSRGYPAFGIRHFAGFVEYNATNFLEKNRDNLAGDIVELMQDSSVTLVADVFGGEVLSTGQVRTRKTAERTHRGEVVKTEEPQNKVHRKTPSLSSQFKTSLGQLIDRMTACFPHFVRCIKPNVHQQKENFVPDFVRKQLRYTGVLEATRIRQEGFSWRPTFSEFVQRYKIIAFDTSKLGLVKENKTSAVRIIEKAGLDVYHVGKTRLFLKFYHVTDLENCIKKYFSDVTKAQAYVRSFFARRRFDRLMKLKRMSEAERSEQLRIEKEEAEKRKKEALALAELEARAAEQRAVEAAALKEIKALEAQHKEEELRRIAAQQEAELEALARAAAEARAEKAQLEADAKKVRRDRAQSQKLRREQAEQMAQEARSRAEAEAKAHAEHLAAKEAIESTLKAEKEALEKKERELLEKLQKAEEEARQVKEKADADAAAAAAAKEEELRKLAEEKAAEEEAKRKADWKRDDFNLKDRVKEICPVQSSDVQITQYTACGWIKKMGSARKTWHKRWFVLDVRDQTVKYFATEKSTKEKNGFELEDLQRAIIPAPSSGKHSFQHKYAEKKFLFVIETAQRTFYCSALTEASQLLWVAILGSIGDFNEMSKGVSGFSSRQPSTHTSPTKN